MVNYTFIIPHKDCLTLLKRCIASIPVRDDIQIIVVDDHSNHEIQDFNSLPSRIELFRLVDYHGAGAARNEGLLHARGKWILFADCDDYYYYKNPIDGSNSAKLNLKVDIPSTEADKIGDQVHVVVVYEAIPASGSENNPELWNNTSIVAGGNS